MAVTSGTMTTTGANTVPTSGARSASVGSLPAVTPATPTPTTGQLWPRISQR